VRRNRPCSYRDAVPHARARSGARALCAAVTGGDLDAKIKEQGDKVLRDGKMSQSSHVPCAQAHVAGRSDACLGSQVRELKAAKAPKDEISAAVEVRVRTRQR